MDVVPALVANRESAVLRKPRQRVLQSIWSASPRRSSKRRCSLSHTPASCHSLRRCQQVIPEPQPISFGSISQGIPLLRTNTTPVRAWSTLREEQQRPIRRLQHLLLVRTKTDLIMHRVTQERTHRECGWKHGEGHGFVTLDRKEPPRRLDKQCLLMEVRLLSVIRSWLELSAATKQSLYLRTS